MTLLDILRQSVSERYYSTTRRYGSVYLCVVKLSIYEVCYVNEGYVGSAVVLYMWGVSWDEWSSRLGVIGSWLLR